MIKLAVLASALLLTGCNAHQSPFTKRASAADDPSFACFSAAKADPAFQRLRDLTGGPDGPTLEMRVSKAVPDEAEKTLLSAAAARLQACFNDGRAFRAANLSPQHINVLEASNASNQGAMARLYAGELTYGQYITERERIQAVQDAAWSGASQATRQAAIESERATALRGLQASQAMQSIQPPQVVYQPAPVYQAPRTINCTSQRVLNQVQTNCY